MQLLVALNIIGAFAQDGAFVLPPHVVLTMVEVLSDFPAPSQKKVQKLVHAKCDELTTEWNGAPLLLSQTLQPGDTCFLCLLAGGCCCPRETLQPGDTGFLGLLLFRSRCPRNN